MESLEMLILSGCSNLKCFPEIDGKMECLLELYLDGSGIKEERTNSMALMLPSLLGLSSLQELKLRDCNLCEGDIPSDISRLSYLKRLDLGGNNFISIPSCLTQFSKLEFLRLSNCRALKSLPELPTSIDVRIHGCASLEIVANPSEIYSLDYRLSHVSKIAGFNCFRLAENIDALTLLKKNLKGNSRDLFDIIIPGSEIPEWFSPQRGDSSIKIDLPLEVRNDSQWMGVALCCIFVSNDASGDGVLWFRAVIHDRYSRQANCTQSNFQGRHSREVYSFGWVVNDYLGQPVTKDHILIRYFSRDILYPPISLEDKCGERLFVVFTRCDGYMTGRFCRHFLSSLVDARFFCRFMPAALDHSGLIFLLY
ncbi:TMV resistance protein N-like [Gossypium australe]|uniref:TMV resistance protein N-like n=1 Tax=Gossypium australe TaxID=47621 RepID=A0A5B6VU27_9ROSI|nr:TMV resistance protein N-like [Gossypium australe]